MPILSTVKYHPPVYYLLYQQAAAPKRQPSTLRTVACGLSAHATSWRHTTARVTETSVGYPGGGGWLFKINTTEEFRNINIMEILLFVIILILKYVFSRN